jgi:hypothetical protein
LRLIIAGQAGFVHPSQWWTAVAAARLFLEAPAGMQMPMGVMWVPTHIPRPFGPYQPPVIPMPGYMPMMPIYPGYHGFYPPPVPMMPCVRPYPQQIQLAGHGAAVVEEVIEQQGQAQASTGRLRRVLKQQQQQQQQ